MLPPESSVGPLERLRKRLYASKEVDGITQAQSEETAVHAPQHWQSEVVENTEQKQRMSVTTIFFICAVLFFVLAGIVALAVILLGGRSISTDNIEITVSGAPSNVAGGKAVSLPITITNKNPTELTGAVLTLDFPDGTTDPDDPTIPLPHYSETIGVIGAGEVVHKTVRATFFGTENQSVSIPVTLEYATGNSNATFLKKINHDFTITTSPVAITIKTLSEVSSGQPLTVSVSVRSNATTPLQNVAVRAEFPFGFAIASSNPEPVTGSLFSIGTLAPGEEREIKVTGTLTGQNGEDRVFKFTAGQLKSGDSRTFGVSYILADRTVRIAKPFLAVSLSLNQTADDTVIVSGGETVSGILSWVNSLTSTVSDAKIAVKFTGDAVDPESIDTTSGFYRSSDKTLLFDRTSNQGLANVLPNDTGNSAFMFSSKTGEALSALRSPTMTLTVSVSGRRVGGGNVSEAITSTLTRTIKVQSDLLLGMRAIRTIGKFANTGPWPPEPDRETTYTIELESLNSVNAVAGATARMVLPSYVRFTGQTTSGVTYEESTRTVEWSLGDMSPGEKGNASFQVALLPSASQKGTSPTLVEAGTISGFDRFVQKQVTGNAPSVDTQTESDPEYKTEFGAIPR